MFYTNATFFQLPDAIDFSTLEKQLPEFPIKECGSQEEYSFGSAPLFESSDVWSLQSNNCFLMRLTKSEKVLPASVVNDELKRKVAEKHIREGRHIGRKERMDIKDELIYSLRPKAFSKNTDVWMHIDNEANLFVIYSSNASLIELSFKHLQTMLGSFPIKPLSSTEPPSQILSNWLMNSELPANMETGDECELFDISDQDATIRFKSLDPLSREVTRHLEESMNVKILGLKWSEKMSFLVKRDLTLSKVKFDSLLKESASNDSGGDHTSDTDARFALSSLTTRELFKNMTIWFKIEPYQ